LERRNSKKKGRRKAHPLVEGGSSSSGLTSAPSTAADVELRMAELKAQLHVQFKITDPSLSTIVEQHAHAHNALAARMR
jgi:hypothetical protein